jgi:hypothetical protein
MIFPDDSIFSAPLPGMFFPLPFKWLASSHHHSCHILREAYPDYFIWRFS